MAEKVRCPLMKDQEIDLYTCFEIHTVVDGTSPKLIAPSEIFDNDDFENICKQCKNHRLD
ncbi:hypothetical protein [uncultured Thomasclavelia sp.]|uniref:hypothetical protein n=1 Tax=uncultured Thomasclavelia sp. TaxID=3025759 RepID=UPI0026297052|nr:hypothetical protein [uncultured Thomasclavelia sp.]WRK52296.1 hypothetical protein SD457_17935 [Coprobacillaceae bacterium CR2/5/TPMF4]